MTQRTRRPVEWRHRVIAAAHERLHVAGRWLDRDHHALEQVSDPMCRGPGGVSKILALLHGERAFVQRLDGGALQRRVNGCVEAIPTSGDIHAGAFGHLPRRIDEIL